MGKNPNNFTIYIRDENIPLWERVGKSFKSDFVNWTLRNKLSDYLNRDDITLKTKTKAEEK